MKIVECPECGKDQDLSDHLPNKACDDEEYTCRACGHEFKIGWYAVAEVR